MNLITNDISRCSGCNRCIRNCPVEEANIAYVDEEGHIKVRIDSEKCIACGSCIHACKHGARDYADDTERFIADLRSGARISLFSAPASRANMNLHGRILTWLRRLGLRKVYDVSFGADICTWAYIRFIQRYKPEAIISQPCPAIVNYILTYKPELIDYLIPVHSPMLCTAIYMRNVMGVTDRIAALSPCIAKSSEFAQTNYIVNYNVTFLKLEQYILDHGVVLPEEESGFDHADSALGSIYSMPGGLKENVEFYLGKTMRVDKAEGPEHVYHALDTYAAEIPANLPHIFDVLNCADGCNLGSGSRHERSIFEINTTMESARKKATRGRRKSYFDKLYATFDRQLNLNDYMRRYQRSLSRPISISDWDIEEAFLAMGKTTPEQRSFDCSACGSLSCHGMARKIAKGVNTALNCMEKVRSDISYEHTLLLSLQRQNLSDIERIVHDISNIKELSDNIMQSIGDVNSSVDRYATMASEINRIAMHINIISLNASVEAARAGSAGLPFAVIAEEIRRLAMSSGQSVAGTEEASADAKQAIELINNFIDAISTAVGQAYDNISSISESTKEVLASEEC